MKDGRLKYFPVTNEGVLTLGYNNESKRINYMKK